MSDQYYNSYITYGWDDNIFGKRIYDDEIFWYKFGRCTQQPMDWRSECLRAADLIYQSTDKQILIHFSGGIDSEIVCKSFLENGHPFKVRICRFNDNLNKHDIDYAIKFCKQYNIDYSFFELNILEYFKTDCYHYRDIKYPNPFWHKNLHKMFLDNGFGYQIIGEGDPFLSHDLLNIKKQSYKDSFHFPGCPIRPWAWNKNRALDDDIYLMIYEAFIEVSAHMDEYNIDGCCLFYIYTPELLYSYLMENLVQDWLTYCKLKELPNNRTYPYAGGFLSKEEYKNIGHIGGGNSIMRFKKNLKFNSWPELNKRPKYTGLEMIKPQVIKFINKISKLQPFDSPGNNVVTIPYSKLIQTLKFKIGD